MKDVWLALSACLEPCKTSVYFHVRRLIYKRLRSSVPHDGLKSSHQRPSSCRGCGPAAISNLYFVPSKCFVRFLCVADRVSARIAFTRVQQLNHFNNSRIGGINTAWCAYALPKMKGDFASNTILFNTIQLLLSL